METREQDRRLFDRFDARFPAKIKDSRGEFGDELTITNASAQGAYITTKDRLFLHDSVSIELKLPDHPNPFILRGHVIWTKNVNPSTWDVGIKFYNVNLVHMSRLYNLVVETV